MRNILRKRTIKSFYRAVSIFVTITFISSSVIPPTYAQSLPAPVLNLPMPGTLVPVSSAFTPALIKGLTVYPDNPLKFDFIIDRGDNNLQGDTFQDESINMVKYFLAALTVPEDELWVNLSPYEGGRIVSDGLGQTIMGSDMLAQDYLLKQLTASLMYPEDELGHKFWDRVHAKVQEKFGTTEIPTNTFNKVWIVPEDAAVYVEGSSAFVISSKLKVMLEEDYLSLNENRGNASLGADRLSDSDSKGVSGVASEIIREVLIPEIEKEVNQGENFAKLRQIFNSLILAAWYKQNLKDGLLGQVYVDQNKTRGVDTQDKQINQKIYDQYIEAFKTGVYNYIKEDYDPTTQDVIPRKYFSGGVEANKIFKPGQLRTDRNMSDNPASERAALPNGDEAKVTVRLDEYRPEVDRIAAWMRQDRFKRIHPNRIWTPEEIANIRGTVDQSSSFQNRMARKLYNLMAEMDAKGDYVATGGVMDGPSAAAMAEQGQRALYLSGWQVSDWWGHPDLAKYPLDTVPNVVADINKYLENKDQAQQIQIRKLVVKLDKLFLELFRAVREKSQDELTAAKTTLTQKFVDAFSDNDLKIFVNAFRNNADARLNEMFGFIVDQAIVQKSDTSQEKRNLLRQVVYSSLERELIDYLIPIYADGDTGHNSIKELIRLFNKVGAAGVHIEDQDPACKKCGHMNGKVIVSLFEHYKRLQEARKEADKLGSEMVIIARTDAEAANLLTSNADPRDHYFIMGTTNERLLSLADLIRLTRRETLAQGTLEEVMSALEADFPDLAQGVRNIWRLRGEVDGQRLDYYENLRLPGTDQNVASVQDVWDSKEAIEFGEINLKPDTVLEDSKGRQMTVQQVLDREPVNIDEEINATYQLTGLWNNHAQLKIYTQAVADQIQDEGQRNAWKDATDPLKVTLSHDQMRVLAREYGVTIAWNAEKARTYEGFYQIDSNLGIINASVRARVFAQIADNIWMEQAKPDAKEAEEFARNVDSDSRAQGVFKSLNLSPSFNWLNPNNWKSALTAEQIANIHKAMAQPEFDWNNSETWGASYATSVQAMVDAIREFSGRAGKAGFGFQFVTVLQDHVMTLAMANAARGLVAEGMGHYVFNTHAQEHKTAARFLEHQWHAGVDRVTAENDILERGSTSTGPKGGTDTQFQKQKSNNGEKTSSSPVKATIDDVLQARHPDVFGVKTVNGRQLDVLETIGEATELFGRQRDSVLARRADILRWQQAGTVKPVWNDPVLGWADPSKAYTHPLYRTTKSVAQIRKGMLDNALGIKSDDAWRLNNEVQPSARFFKRGLELTGPREDEGMAITALNAAKFGVVSDMPDYEDATPDEFETKQFGEVKSIGKMYDGTMKKGYVFHHPTKNKDYTIEIDKEEMPVLIARIPGLGLKDRRIFYNGKKVPETISKFIVHLLNNFDKAVQNTEEGFAGYIPKLESPEEAILVANIIMFGEEKIGVPHGTLKFKLLNERNGFSRNQEVIMWVLAPWLLGSNVGRWDYTNSLFELHLGGITGKGFMDPSKFTMNSLIGLHPYSHRNALLTLLASIDENGEMTKGAPIGGMFAGMETGNEEADARARQNIFTDKLRERLTGLFILKGKLYDTYHQSWIASPVKDYVLWGARALQAAFSELEGLVKELSPQQQAVFQSLGLIDENLKITPYVLTEERLNNLWSEADYNEMYAVAQGEITIEEIEYAIYMASEYGFQILNGMNAAKIPDYRTGGAIMNDFATYEIFWHWPKHLMDKNLKLTKAGRTVRGTEFAEGTPVTLDLIKTLLDERRLTVNEYFQVHPENPMNFDRSLAPVTMDVLAMHYENKEFVPYGARVLISLRGIKDAATQQAIINAIKSPREAIVAEIERAKRNKRSQSIPKLALQERDFVYDFFPEYEKAILDTVFYAPLDQVQSVLESRGVGNAEDIVAFIEQDVRQDNPGLYNALESVDQLVEQFKVLDVINDTPFVRGDLAEIQYAAASSPIVNQEVVKMLEKIFPKQDPRLINNLARIYRNGNARGFGSVIIAPFNREKRLQLNGVNAYTVPAEQDKVIEAVIYSGSLPVIAQLTPTAFKGSSKMAEHSQTPNVGKIELLAKWGVSAVSYELNEVDDLKSRAQTLELTSIINKAKEHGLPTVVYVYQPAGAQQLERTLQAAGHASRLGAHLVIIRRPADKTFDTRLKGLVSPDNKFPATVTLAGDAQALGQQAAELLKAGINGFNFDATPEQSTVSAVNRMIAQAQEWPSDSVETLLAGSGLASSPVESPSEQVLRALHLQEIQKKIDDLMPDLQQALQTGEILDQNKSEEVTDYLIGRRNQSPEAKKIRAEMVDILVKEVRGNLSNEEVHRGLNLPDLVYEEYLERVSASSPVGERRSRNRLELEKEVTGILSEVTHITEDKIKKALKAYARSFADELGIDSIDLTSFIVVLEGKYAIDISDQEAKYMRMPVLGISPDTAEVFDMIIDKILASSGSSVSSPVGGIDLDPGLMNLQIKRDPNGVPLPLPQQPIQSINIEGLLPVIINVTPVNLPLLLGGAMSEKEGSQDLSRRSLDPVDHKARIEAEDTEEVAVLN